MIILSLVMILINNAVTNRREMSIFFNRIVIISLIYCVLIDLESLNLFTAGYVTPRVGDPTIFGVTTVKEVLEVSSLGLGHEGAASTYGMELIDNTLSNIGSVGWGLITINHISQIYHIYLYLVSILILIISNSKELKQIEYPLMLLFIIVGGVFLMTTKDLVTIFLAIELQSYGLYLICTMNRNSEYSTTGGLMYFLLGGLSSCIIVLGIGLIYGNSGATNIDGVFLIGMDGWQDKTSPVKEDEYLNISLLLITIGFLFKLGGAPFHYWSPDVYDSIPTIVTTFVAIVAKISIFILIFQLTSAWQLSSIVTGSEVDWTYSFIISSLVSIIIGSLLGLTQFRIKKLLAYSTISHIGFILLGLGISSVESYQAFLFYLTQYSISNLNIFLIVLLVGYAYAKKELMKSPIQYISQLKGLYNENAMLTISLAITLFSFIGLPPLLGFYPKQMILSSALDQGYYFIVLVAITASVISAVYYLHIIKETFFLYPEGEGSSNETGGRENVEGRLNIENVESRRGIEKGWEMPRLTLMISIITLLTLTFMFISSSLMNLMQILISY